MGNLSVTNMKLVVVVKHSFDTRSSIYTEMVREIDTDIMSNEASNNEIDATWDDCIALLGKGLMAYVRVVTQFEGPNVPEHRFVSGIRRGTIPTSTHQLRKEWLESLVDHLKSYTE
jgi:hypothetical protein